MRTARRACALGIGAAALAVGSGIGAAPAQAAVPAACLEAQSLYGEDDPSMEMYEDGPVAVAAMNSEGAPEESDSVKGSGRCFRQASTTWLARRCS